MSENRFYNLVGFPINTHLFGYLKVLYWIGNYVVAEKDHNMIAVHVSQIININYDKARDIQNSPAYYGEHK